MKKYKPLKVKWLEKRDVEKLPFPSYPPKKTWEDFLNDNGSNLPEWILERLKLLDLDEIPMYIVDKEVNEVMRNISESYVTSNVLQGKDGRYYVFVKSLNGEKDILCHESQFIEKIDIHSLKKGDKLKFYLPPFKNTAKYIHINDINIEPAVKKDILSKITYFHSKTSFNEKTKNIANAIHSIRVPVLKMWANMSLDDDFVPEYFKTEINRYKELAFKIMINKNCHPSLRKELQFFLSAIHEDTVSQYYRYIIDLSNNGKLNDNMALLLGRMNKKWQQKLFYNIINQLPNPYVLQLLATAMWRDEKFVNFVEKYTPRLLPVLLEALNKSFDIVINVPTNKSKKILTNNLELLFGLLRLREKNPAFLHPERKITKEFLATINKITRYVVKNEIELISKIEFSLKNDTFTKMPDILYALNVYLRGDLNMAKSIKVTGVTENENGNN